MNVNIFYLAIYTSWNVIYTDHAGYFVSSTCIMSQNETPRTRPYQYGYGDVTVVTVVMWWWTENEIPQFINGEHPGIGRLYRLYTDLHAVLHAESVISLYRPANFQIFCINAHFNGNWSILFGLQRYTPESKSIHLLPVYTTVVERLEKVVQAAREWLLLQVVLLWGPQDLVPVKWSVIFALIGCRSRRSIG